MQITSRFLRIAFCLTLLVTTISGASPSDTSSSIDELELARRLTELERFAAESDPADVRRLVRRFALDTVHSRVRVRLARVIQTYTRMGWKTRPYFAVNYTRADYFYLDETDPEFQKELAKNLHWVSVVKSLPDRQLMFELAIDEATYEKLERDMLISFECEIAGVIRGGKSVYSRLISFEEEGADSR